MKKLGWVVSVLVLAIAVAGTVLYGQETGRGAAGGRGARQMEQERIRTMLQQAGFNDREIAASEKAIAAKLKARRALQADLAKLRQVADDPASTDKQLDDAVASYQKALAQYRDSIQAEDNALTRELSPRSRAKALAAGLLDNGLGLGSGRTRGGGTGGGVRGGQEPQ